MDVSLPPSAALAPLFPSLHFPAARGDEELPSLCPEQEPTLSHRGVFHTCEVEAGQNRSRASAVPALESFISNVGFSLPRDPSFPSPRLLKRDCPWESVHAEHGRCSQSCFLCFSLPGFLSRVSSLRYVEFADGSSAWERSKCVWQWPLCRKYNEHFPG